MPEMPDVVLSEDIEVEWGNEIRDRTIQRYTDVTERTAEHGSPSNGDLAFMADTGLTYVYYSSAWRLIAGPEEIDGLAEDAGASLTTSYVSIAAVSLAIPTHWDQWKCTAWATGLYQTNSTIRYRFQIDGTNGTESGSPAAAEAGSSYPFSHIGRRTGMVTTGSRSIDFMIKKNVADAGSSTTAITVYARATRTA